MHSLPFHLVLPFSRQGPFRTCLTCLLCLRWWLMADTRSCWTASYMDAAVIKQKSIDPLALLATPWQKKGEKSLCRQSILEIFPARKGFVLWTCCISHCSAKGCWSSSSPVACTGLSQMMWLWLKVEERRNRQMYASLLRARNGQELLPATSWGSTHPRALPGACLMSWLSHTLP